MSKHHKNLCWFLLLTPLLLAVIAISITPKLLHAQIAQDSRPNEVGGPVRFVPLEIWFDTGTHPLAAYQFELKTLAGNVAIVGIEGGDLPSFRAAPYYDPAALHQNRVIIGAFSTDPMLPSGNIRVARIHVMVTGNTAPEYQIVVQAAATSDGSPITAQASVQEGTTP